MRLPPTLLGGLLLGALACGSGGGSGGRSGDRRGVSTQREGAHDLARPTPPAGAPMRGDLVVVSGGKETRIGQADLADCPAQGCPLAKFVALDAPGPWCIAESGMPRRELPAEDVKRLVVIGRTKGGVKLVPPGIETALARSPARLYPCD